MTPAEFDTWRRKLGLSVKETGDICGRVAERTVNRWISGDLPLPRDATAALAQLESAMLNAVENVVDHATDMVDEGPIILWRYKSPAAQAKSPHASSLPPGAHAMLVAWAAAALEDEGVASEIHWAD